MNCAQLVDILILILAYLCRSAGLWLQEGELRFPEAQSTLIQTEHLGHLFDAVVQLLWFVLVQCHSLIIEFGAKIQIIRQSAK